MNCLFLITDHSVVGLNKNGNTELVDIISDSEGCMKWKNIIVERINASKCAFEIYMMITKAYSLMFCSMTAPYLSQKDLSEILSDAWIWSEYANDNGCLSYEELTNMFKSADPIYLMTGEEYDKYIKLDEIQMYYLQSRYYDASIQIFISPDMPEFMCTSGGVYSYNLYAYCENEPVNSSDHRGTFLLSFYRDAQVVKSVINYSQNGKSDYEETGKLILAQHLLKNLYYGVAEMPGVGCEIVATYNAMVLLGKKPSLRSIILEFESNGSQWLLGTMGSNPNKIRRYLFWHSPVMFYTCNSLERVVKSRGVIIFAAWNVRGNVFAGLHTIAIRYTGTMFYAYNYYKNSTRVKYFKHWDQIFAEGEFIVAYYMPERGFHWIG